MSNLLNVPPVIVTTSPTGVIDVTPPPPVLPVSGTAPVTIVGPVMIEDTTGNPLNSTSGSLNVDVTNTVPVTGTFFQATQPISGSVSVSNFPATQPVSGTVAVSNFPATTAVTQSTSPWVISGAVTETNVDKNFGTWAYYAGTNGTVAVTSGQRVLGIGTHATTAGSFTINGGTSIPIPAGVSVNIEPLANLVAPTIVFTGTDSYFIEVVS